MTFTCVQRPQCGHYPHTEIVEGQEEWVRVRMGGDWALSARHKDCLKGLYYVTRDGRKVSPYCADYDIAWTWVLNNQGQSVDYATRHGGYAILSTDATE